MPTVSVVITNYNSEAFLEETVKSVLSQSHRDLELIIADDGSTDRSPAMIRQFASADKRVIGDFSPDHQGLSANWNRAAERTRGDYLAFLGHDDQMSPDKIERQLAFMRAHPQYGVSTHEMEVFDGQTGSTLYFTDDRYAPPPEDIRGLFATNWFFRRETKTIPSSTMATRGFMLSAKFDVRFPLRNEWLHMIDCMQRTGLKWGHLRERLGRYRVHSRQMHTSPEAASGSFREAVALIAVVSERYPELARLARRKRDFIYFQHLLLGWFPESEREKREREFYASAAWPSRMYYDCMKRYLSSRGLFASTRVLRKAVKKLTARW